MNAQSGAVFQNRKAAFLWVFMGIWMAMLIVFTSLFLRDGTPAGHSTLFFAGVLAVFWIGGLAATGHVLSRPLTEVHVASTGEVRVRRRYLGRSVERRYGPSVPLSVEVLEDRDSDGDPYFRARLRVSEADSVDLWEGHDREQAQAEVERFHRLRRSGR